MDELKALILESVNVWKNYKNRVPSRARGVTLVRPKAELFDSSDESEEEEVRRKKETTVS